jgi:putative phosphoesterase
MIGVISDTHDNVYAIKKAVEFFNNKKVEFVVFAGDFIAPLSVEPFKNLECPLKGVFGNNEGDKLNLNKKLHELGTEFHYFLEFEHEGKSIAVYHGQVAAILEALVKSGIYDIVIAGHTHTPETTVEGKTLLLNPGECCGYLTGVQTIATLDIKEMKAEIHEL